MPPSEARGVVLSQLRTMRPLAGQRILIVEDEVLIAIEVQEVFESRGARIVGPAMTFSQAMELAKEEDITLALLDVRLDRVSVSPVARILASRGIPFLFYSGQTRSDPALADWPECSVISKPASAGELVSAVARLVDGDRHDGGSHIAAVR